jgi:formate dehydrogenase subunit delta
MSTPDKSPAKLIYMANQIGTFFAAQDKKNASSKIAEHILKFWDPRMRAQIMAHVERDGAGLDPQALEAVRLLKAQNSGRLESREKGGIEGRRGISRLWRRLSRT